MAPSATAAPMHDHVLETLPPSFVHSKIFQIVMQLLASTPSSRNDNILSLPELTFILNDTSPLLYNISGSEETLMNTTVLIRADEVLPNVTFEPAQQQMGRTTFICIIAIGSVFAILTTGGNLMVMVSFKIDKQLQTISNCFLVSLAVADIAIGLVSIPLMTYYMAADTRWGIGYAMCQFWLCLDYMMSNASVLNLLLISFDRYFSVTRPLTYRPRRTAKKAFMMIASTYIASAMLWPPWIISWPYIEGRFTSSNRCVIQFIETNQFASVGTAIAAFWLPLAIMIILYSRVYYETKKRQREIMLLQAGQAQFARTRRELQSIGSSSSAKNSFRGRTANSSATYPSKIEKKRNRCLRACLGKAASSSMDESTDALQIGPDEASVASSNYTHYYCAQNRLKRSPPTSPLLQDKQENKNLLSEPAPAGGRVPRKNRSSTDRPPTYTVLIELKNGEHERPSVRLSSCDSDDTSGPSDSPFFVRNAVRSRSQSYVPDKMEEMRKNMISQQLFNGTFLARKLLSEQRKSEKERRKNERKQESKAAKTLSAILLAFIITWTPYNVIVCWEAFYKNSIPEVYFHIAYFLCYINSTINPFCYAFCNARFRLTYMRILTGNWKRQPSGLSSMAFFKRS